MGWIILLVIVVVIIMVVGASKENEKQQAKDAYENSLASLKSEPASGDRRQRTLALGRVYSNLMRDKKGNTLFDEVALMNDINAACAATHQVISKQSQIASAASIEDRLIQLQTLRDKGLIDDDDFTRRKREITSEI